MKRIFLLVATVLLMAVGHHADAAIWSITKLTTDISVQSDASIDIVETIAVRFTEPRHGIFRTIPEEYTTSSGGRAHMPVTMRGVQQDGQDVPYSLSRDGNDLVYKIGRANKEITGDHTYVLTYTVQAAVNFFTDHDELYWNATGNTWDVPVPTTTATVHLPGEVAATSITTTCYSGAVGSTVKNCKAQATDAGATFTATEPLTIVVGWPTGVVTKPSDYDELRTSQTSDGWDWVRLTVGTWWMNLLIGLGGILGSFGWWWRNGRDPGGPKTLIAQYDPPLNIRPGELDVIVHEKVRKDIIAATIVDLAVRGYLKIIETEKPKILGISRGKNYILKKLRDSIDGQRLKTYERVLLDGLFSTTQSASVYSALKLSIRKLTPESWRPADGPSLDEVSLDDLKDKFYVTWETMKTILEKSVVADGYFVKNPAQVRAGFIVLGSVLIGCAIWLSWLGAIGFVVAGLACFVTAAVAPRRTPLGAQAKWHGLGFKEYLSKAEKYRLQWQEKEHIFEQFLPYAMVFGVADKWSKALADVARSQPSWYEGQSGVMFSAMALNSSLQSFSHIASASAVSPAASGSSGFGGGGFSGGGGGGGGGGSW